jgi:hypothetical protein
MFVKHILYHGSLQIQHQRLQIHPRHFSHYYSVINCVICFFFPGKWAMVLYDASFSLARARQIASLQPVASLGQKQGFKNINIINCSKLDILF